MKTLALPSLLVGALLFATTGCSTTPVTESQRDQLKADGNNALKSFTREDPSLNKLLDDSAGYAIFPSVGKGGFIAGGAYGRGLVFQDGDWIGYSDVAQGTVGATAGGASFHELIVFKDDNALNNFKAEKLTLSANLQGVAIKAGAGAAANWSDGVVVFVKPEAGALIDASIGGQKFSFDPADDADHMDHDVDND